MRGRVFKSGGRHGVCIRFSYFPYAVPVGTAVLAWDFSDLLHDLSGHCFRKNAGTEVFHEVEQEPVVGSPHAPCLRRSGGTIVR